MQRSLELLYKGMILRGMYHPADASPPEMAPHAVIFHGFTGDKVDDHCMHVHLSRCLSGAGVAAVRFDFLGSGESDGVFSDMTLSDELAQAGVILDRVLDLAGGDSSRLILIGHSMGALIAALLAGDLAAGDPAAVPGALVLIAPAGNLIDLIESRVAGDAVRRLPDGSADLEGYLLGPHFLPDARDILLSESFRDRIASYRGPVTVVHGSGDDTVPVSWSRAFAGYYGREIPRYIIPGAGHTFARADHELALMEGVRDFIHGVFEIAP